MTWREGQAIGALVLVAIVAIDFARCYSRSKNTGWTRLLDAGRGSATILWLQLGFVASCLMAALDAGADWVTQIVGAPGADDTIKQWIGSYFSPQNVGIVVGIYIMIAAIARARTLLRRPPE